MSMTIVTTGHLTKPNTILLDEDIAGDLNDVRITIEPILNSAKQRKAGALRGLIKLEPSFDEPLEDFQEYMK